MRRALWILISVPCFWVRCQAALATNGSQSASDEVKGLTLALIVTESQAAGKATDQWQYLISDLLCTELENVESIRCLPDSTIAFALRELGISSSTVIDAALARRLGEAMEARRLIWGSYSHEEGLWGLKFRLVNVATGTLSTPLLGSSADLYEAVAAVRKAVLAELGVKTTPTEEKRMERRISKSTKALELFGRAFALSEKGESLSSTEAILRQAVILDPESACALNGLARVLMAEDSLDEALLRAKAAIRADPEYAGAYSTLGAIYLFRGVKSLAQEQFKEALRLSPFSAQSHLEWASILQEYSKWNEARASLEVARQLAPFDPMIRAELARMYLRCGEPGKAAVEARMAERYYSEANDKDPQVARSLTDAFALLNDVPSAAKFCEKYLASAKRLGAALEPIPDIEAKLTDLRSHLTLNFVAATQPVSLTPQELETTLRERLTEQEYRLLTIPFAGNAEIEARARALVAGAAKELDKAKLLFNGLNRPLPIEFPQAFGRTAAGTWKAWPDPKAVISCQDFTFLFMAMSRCVGLKSYYVLVDRDYKNKLIHHACAGIFVDGQAILVDPAYSWFGIPHKQFTFLDDLKVIATYLTYSGQTPEEEVGQRIVPSWPLPYFWASVRRSYRGQPDLARQSLRKGLDLAPGLNSPLSLLAQALVEGNDRQWDAALPHLEELERLAPEMPMTHYWLGVVLYQHGRLRESRDQYRTYLQSDTQSLFGAAARTAVARLNEVLSEPH